MVPCQKQTRESRETEGGLIHKARGGGGGGAGGGGGGGSPARVGPHQVLESRGVGGRE